MCFSVYRAEEEQRSSGTGRRLLSKYIVSPSCFTEPRRSFEHFKMKFDETCGK